MNAEYVKSNQVKNLKKNILSFIYFDNIKLNIIMNWKHPVFITCVKLKYLNKYVYHCKFIYTGRVKNGELMFWKKILNLFFLGILEIKKKDK